MTDDVLNSLIVPAPAGKRNQKFKRSNFVVSANLKVNNLNQRYGNDR